MTTEDSIVRTIGVSMEGLTLRVADVERSLAFYKKSGLKAPAIPSGG
jgi:hypothetical protein